MENIKQTRSNGINPMRRVIKLGQTHYLSIPMESIRKYNIEVGDLYEFSFESGSLIFRTVHVQEAAAGRFDKVLDEGLLVENLDPDVCKRRKDGRKS